MDDSSPLGCKKILSAQFVGSFAYVTVKDRLPVILTKVLDNLCRDKEAFKQHYGEVVSKELKNIIGLLSQLKNHIQTNKPIESVVKFEKPYRHDDVKIWTDSIECYCNEFGEYPRWFMASWLFVECFMYKRIHEIFQTSPILSSFDPFAKQKQISLKGAFGSIATLANYTCHEISRIPCMTDQDKKSVFCKLFKASLWGNRCDLSISAGSQLIQEKDILSTLGEFEDNILASDLELVWEHLSSFSRIPDRKRSVGLILDNAGFELVADLCLLTFLLELNLISFVAIYPKTRPWFVSDVTITDFSYTLDFLRNEFKLNVLVDRWDSYLTSGKWALRERVFWTTPHDFSQMESVDSSLYSELQDLQFLLFKGDLNYRKLVGDFEWDVSTPFVSALRNFRPTALAVSRTIKGGAVVGLHNTDNVLKAEEVENWKISGDFALVHFCDQL